MRKRDTTRILALTCANMLYSISNVFTILCFILLTKLFVTAQSQYYHTIMIQFLNSLQVFGGIFL